MTLAILTLLGALVPFVVWLLRRWLEPKPEQVLKSYEDETRKVIADRGDVNGLLDERLRAIGRHPGGQRGGAGQDGAGGP